MDVDNLVTITVAFLAFSFAASATYIVNDHLLGIGLARSDRQGGCRRA
jgi:hypothetical protein